MTLTEPGSLLRREDVIRRRDGLIVSAIAASPKYSTPELLATEQRLVDRVMGSGGATAGVARPDAVESALTQRPTIGPDQDSMVRRLCLDGAGVQVVVGPPGTGKTFALAAAREAWEASGFRVLGAAVARRAAVELTAASGVDATSVAALLAELRHGDQRLLDDRTVVVVDEAGMLGTRPLAEMVEYAGAAGSKLVLVGDPEQLPEIEAGGAFRALCARTRPIVLERNRRQKRAADRRLLDLWRSGDVRSALTIATDAGELVLDASPEESVTRLVHDYTSALQTGADAVMLAPRRSEVKLLNDLARERRAAKGHIAGPALDVRGREFAAGDRVVLRANAPDLGVQNGTRGTVVEVDPQDQRLTLTLPDGTRTTLPSRYVNLPTRHGGASIEHGYALTAHLAQGMTTDRAFVLGSETVYREWGYTAWSRARLGTRFYAVEPEISDEHHTAAPVDVDRFEELVRRLDRSEAQHVALDALPDQAAARCAGAAKHATITYLERALGTRPESFRRRRRWDRAARRIERFRARYGITDADEALGAAAVGDLRTQLAWRKARSELTRDQVRLGRAGPERDARSIDL